MNKPVRKEILIVIAIFVAALLIRLFLFAYPKQFVFDEVYFINFASDYFTGSYYFDLHPPLGKLLLYGFGLLTGFNGQPAVSAIGESFTNVSYAYLRLFPIICGSLIPPIIYLLARRLKLSIVAAVFASIAIIVENSLVVQSKFVLMDNSLILFGFLGLLLYLKSLDTDISVSPRQKFALKLLAGISLSFALSIKWTGASFLGMVLAFELYRAIKQRFSRKEFMQSIFCFVLAPIIVYLSIFYIHFKLLPNPGPGDAFMSQAFKSSSFVDRFAELNKVMLLSNGSLSTAHAYASKWYTWPIMERGIYYWQDSQYPDKMIYLLGNPFVYWLSSLGLIVLLIFVIFKKDRSKTALFLLFGFLLNYLPFALITRPMFLYHYFVALIFAIISLGYILDKIKDIKKLKMIILVILTVFTISFIYFSPLTYGLASKDIHQRFWFSSWR